MDIHLITDGLAEESGLLQTELALVFLLSLAALVAIVALGCLAFLVGRISLESRLAGVVVSEQGELFRVPEEDSKSWFELPAGASLWIRGQAGRYYLVETPSQIEGWVRGDTILID